ncbi:hypothetical protein L9F63_009265, partial [Diploptera punctata]
SYTETFDYPIREMEGTLNRSSSYKLRVECIDVVEYPMNSNSKHKQTKNYPEE